MDKNYYSFKEACELTGYSASAIRYYEQQFSLNIPRDNNSRRIFTEKEVDILFFIKDLQGKGYSNSQIKKIIKNEEVRDQIMDNKAVMEEIIQSEDVKEEIAATIGAIEPKYVKGLEEKLCEIKESLYELNETVNSKERDLMISENMKLKMENKQKAYEIIQLKEKLNYESKKKSGFFARLFRR